VAVKVTGLVAQTDAEEATIATVVAGIMPTDMLTEFVQPAVVVAATP
jgi:hypothetical protein